MKDSMKLTLMFNTDDVMAALRAALKAGLFCGTCVHKLETQDEMSQSDFCPSCQAAVNSQLSLVVESRMKKLLAEAGLPPDSVEITKN